jgi:hypothetical protein
MQRVNYAGVGRFMIRVNEMRDAGGQLLASPDGDTKPRFIKAYQAGENQVKNYSNSNIGILWPDHEVVNVAMGGSEDMVAIDSYLKTEIMNALMPRDWVEQTGQAIATTGTPLLEIVLMVVDGWRKIISQPWEDLYTRILEANGFSDWAVEFTYQNPKLDNKDILRNLAVQVYVQGGMSEDRLYQIMGWQPLSEEEREELTNRRASAGMI